MENSLFQNVYNPDVLSCIANLSNDEVFTPPELANKIIDMLPQELFENPDTTFLLQNSRVYFPVEVFIVVNIRVGSFQYISFRKKSLKEI